MPVTIVFSAKKTSACHPISPFARLTQQQRLFRVEAVEEPHSTKGAHRMYTTINQNRLFSLITRTAAVTFFAASATLVLHAQQSAGTSSSLPTLSLTKTLAAPLDLTVPDDLSYSSSVGEPEMAAGENF